MAKKRAKKRYLTVHVSESVKLKSTVQVKIPGEFYLAEALGELVKQAIEHVQAKQLKADTSH